MLPDSLIFDHIVDDNAYDNDNDDDDLNNNNNDYGYHNQAYNNIEISASELDIWHASDDDCINDNHKQSTNDNDNLKNNYVSHRPYSNNHPSNHDNNRDDNRNNKISQCNVKNESSTSSQHRVKSPASDSEDRESYDAIPDNNNHNDNNPINNRYNHNVNYNHALNQYHNNNHHHHQQPVPNLKKNRILKNIDISDILGISYFIGCFVLDNDILLSTTRTILITTCALKDYKISLNELYKCLQQKHSIKHKIIMNIGISYWLFELVKFIKNRNSKHLRNGATKLLLILFGLFYVLLVRLMNKAGKFWAHLSFWNEIPTILLLLDIFSKRKGWMKRSNNIFHMAFVVMFIYGRCVKMTKLITLFSKQLWIAQNEGKLNDDIHDGYKYGFLCGLPVTLCMGYWLSYKLFLTEFAQIKS